jgi:tetratricopeptide (TPR) repeat protein
MSDKGRIVFLSVPENLRGHIDDDDHFSINPDIPIPVEIPEGKDELNLEELSWEMIISGMLRIIADSGQQQDENLNYYRHFVLRVRPSIMDEFTEAAILKARNGDFELALEILDSLRGLFPFSPVVMLNRALVLEERASMLERRNKAGAEAAFQDAEAAYAEALALRPPFPNTHFNAGFFYLDRKDFSRARECFSLYVDIAEDRERINQAESIVKSIDKNGLADENFAEACQLIRQGKEEEGMARIRVFLEEYPLVWNGWFVLGWALRRLGRWEDGIAAFGKAIDLGGGSSDTRNDLAICLMESGDLKSARRELETALHDDPENIKIISNMGVLALKNGNNDDAAAFFRAVLELDPEDPIAKKYCSEIPS